MENYAAMCWPLLFSFCLFLKSLQTARPSIILILRGEVALLSVIANCSAFRNPSLTDNKVCLYFELCLSGNQTCYVWYKGHTNHLLNYGSLNPNLLTYSARLSVGNMEVRSSLSAAIVVYIYLFFFRCQRSFVWCSPCLKIFVPTFSFSPSRFLGGFSDDISFSYFFLADHPKSFFFSSLYSFIVKFSFDIRNYIEVTFVE